MKISVVIPSYKPREYIRKCLASIAAQTFDRGDFEVLIVLNGCCEPYKSEIEAYIATEMQGIDVQLIQTDCGGVSNARNIGIERARGEYIAFIDDDDFVSPSYLESLYAQAAPETVVFSDTLAYDDATGAVSGDFYMHRGYVDNKPPKRPTLFSIRKLLNGPCCKLIARDIIGDRRFDKRFCNGEDVIMMLEISDRIRHLRLAADDAVYYRRVRPDSANFRSRSFATRAATAARMLGRYTAIVARAPFAYNYPFVLSRYLASVITAFTG